MSENLKDTLKSLLTKLSAVRVTLSDEEQALLDQLILSSRDEVQAHAKFYAPDEAKAMGADEAKAMALKYSPDEAKAMGADEAKAMALKYSPDEAKAMGADEVKAMGLRYSPDEGRVMGIAEAKQYGVVASRFLKPVDTDEVSAHSMPGNLINHLGAHPVLVTIVYDTEMECYKVI